MNNYTNEFANVDKVDLLKKKKKTKQETTHNTKSDKLLKELQRELNLIVLTKPSSELILRCFGK